MINPGIVLFFTAFQFSKVIFTPKTYNDVTTAVHDVIFED